MFCRKAALKHYAEFTGKHQTKLTITRSKSTIETLEKVVKYVQS